jgi:thioredoxin 1
MEINLTDENFEKEISGSELPVLVDFFAVWCEPCKVLGPILEKVAKEFEGKLILIKANVNEIPVISQKFGIEQIPTVVLFEKGKAISGFIGLRNEEDIRKWLGEAIK